MQCTLRRTHSEHQNISNKVHGCPSRKLSKRNTFHTVSEIYEVSSIDWRTIDQRRAIVKFLTPESDGQWRVAALPIRCVDEQKKLRSGAQVSMSGLYLASSTSVEEFRADQSKALKRPECKKPYSGKSCSTRGLPGPSVEHQFQEKAPENKVNRSNKFLGCSSSQSSVICSESYHVNSKGCYHNKSSDLFIDSPVVIDSPVNNKSANKSLRKKARRKEKQNKKISSHIGLTEPEVFSYTHGSSASEIFSHIDHGDELVSYETSPEPSLSDASINKIEAQSDNCPRAPKLCTFNVEFDMVKTSVSSNIRNFHVEHGMTNLDLGIQVKDQEFSILNDSVTETHIQNSSDDVMLSLGFSNMPNSLVLDSVSVGSNNDASANAKVDIKPLDKESSTIYFLKSPGFYSRKGSPAGVVDPYDHTKGKKHGVQKFSSSDVELLVPSKRGKQIKILPRSSNIYKFGNGRTGKENSHSVWQKVQRNDANDCNCEIKKVPMCSMFDAALKDASLLEGNCNAPVVNTSLKFQDKRQPKRKTLKKLKRKDSIGCKQEHNCNIGRGSDNIKGSLDTPERANMQILDIPAQVNDRKGVKCISKPHTQNGCPRAGLYNNRVERVNSESLHISQVLPHTLQPLGSTCNSVSDSDIKNHRTDNKDTSQSKSGDFLDKNLSDAKTPVYLPHLLGGKDSQIENEIPLECSKEKHSSVSTLQKWIPIRVKVPRLTTFGSSLVDHFDGSTEDWTLRDTIEEEVASNSQYLVSSLMLGIDNALCFSQEENSIQKLKNLNACIFQRNENHVTVDCLICKSKDQICSVFDLNANKLAQAVNDACKIQLASEAVQMAIGGPIAEFERVLHFSSPVICQSPVLLSCQTCLWEQQSICRHEIPNISLGCLWQWYEKHGSYGLEIKAEDYEHSRRLGVDRFTFHAYFVPYLSAVQLFNSHKNQCMSNSNEVPAPRLVETHEISETSENCHLPIFSLLVPQPHTKDSSESVNATWSSDIEVLFEYFESDQPQRRKPLYDKIHELVRGNGPTKHKMYGDPSNLVTMNLHDLHPRSWYSVAWYPIYSIPDSNFQAAFLTFHSLGHFERRGTKFDSPSVDACVVSPVVGLQSYNAQGECWFHLRHSVVGQTTGISILKERLRTLEEAASVMATAVVNKGSEKSVNRHPDYEFFLSRRSY